MVKALLSMGSGYNAPVHLLDIFLVYVLRLVVWENHVRGFALERAEVGEEAARRDLTRLADMRCHFFPKRALLNHLHLAVI